MNHAPNHASRETLEPRVAVILVNWNGADDTLDALQSLSQQAYRNARIIVVDNGSHDDSVARIRARFPDVTVIENSSNEGFAGGNNRGIEYALKSDAEYFFLLNNDTHVEPDALCRLVAAACAHPEFGILSPAIFQYFRRAEPWFVGAQLDMTRGIAIHDDATWRRAPEQFSAASLFELPWTSGCAMLLPRAAMEQLRGFDERFYLLWEDVDLSLRTLAAGWKIGLAPDAKIYHKAGRSFAAQSTLDSSWPGATYFFVRNNLLFLRAHAGCEYSRAARRVLSATLRSAARQSWKQRSPASLAMWARAVWHHGRARYGAF